MDHARALLSLVLLGLSSVGHAGPSLAGEPEFLVIVSPQNPVSSVDRDFLRDAFLRRATDWGNGVAIRPLDLASRFPTRERFSEEVLHKTSAQLKSYWYQQIFSGKGVPPPEAASAEEAIAFVLANAGAIAYLPAGADPGQAKVVRVK